MGRLTLDLDYNDDHIGGDGDSLSPVSLSREVETVFGFVAIEGAGFAIYKIVRSRKIHTTHESTLIMKYNDSESTLATHYIKYNDYESTLVTYV